MLFPAMFQFFYNLYLHLEFVAVMLMLTVTLNFAFAFVDPYTGCALSSVVRDIACPSASYLSPPFMPPFTQACDAYVSIRHSLCPPMFRTQWYL